LSSTGIDQKISFITRDQLVANQVTSTKCHEMHVFPLNEFVFTIGSHTFMFRLIYYFTISQQYLLKNDLCRYPVNSMQNQMRPTNSDSAINYWPPLSYTIGCNKMLC